LRCVHTNASAPIATIATAETASAVFLTLRAGTELLATPATDCAGLLACGISAVPIRTPAAVSIRVPSSGAGWLGRYAPLTNGASASASSPTPAKRSAAFAAIALRTMR
jgi:hypothetical protein